MSPEIDQLLSEMRGYCARRGIGLPYLSRLAVNDGKFVSRLEAGGECLPSTMAKIRRYMADNPPPETATPDQGGGTDPDRAPEAKVA